MRPTTRNYFSCLFVLTSAAVLILTNAALLNSTVQQFQSGPFTFPPSAGIYNLTGLGFDNITGGVSVLAFGDFNSDKFTDIVTVDDANATLSIFLWDPNNYVFNNSESAPFPNKIVAAIPADIDFDGLVDLLVLTDNLATGNYDYYGYLGTRSNTPFDCKRISSNFPITHSLTNESHYPNNPILVSPTTTHCCLFRRFIPVKQLLIGSGKLIVVHSVSFIVMNPTGDRVAFSFVNSTDAPGARTLQLIETNFNAYASSDPSCLDYNNLTGSTIKRPNFNSFIDLNGDCRPDLFIMSTLNNTNYFEIWIRNSTSATFCLIEYTPVASNVASLAFADVNGDAGIDLVYIQQNTVPIVHIIFNQYKNSAGSACTGYVLNSSNLPFLNNSDVNRAYIYDAVANTSATLVYPLSNQGDIPANALLYAYDPNDRPHQLRVGDVNMDGFPDLLVTVSTNGARKTWVLYNLVASINSSARAFGTKPPAGLAMDINAAINDTNSYYAAFFDFNEVGTQSFIYINRAEDGSSIIEGYYNYLNRGSSFLKALGLNGAQYGSDFYAGMYFGSSFECEVTDINGGNTLKKGSQLSRGSYNALQLPYGYIGLGTTNNYIENFVFGLPLSNSNTQTWSFIIPNSQLIITPLTNITSNWKIGVFVKPTSSTVMVVIIIVLILVVFGLAIIYLQHKEKEEDKTGEKPIPFNFG